jgi:hypothetical protein
MSFGEPHLDSPKDTTRNSWIVNFEAVATEGNDEDALPEATVQ